jgi:putative two-component system response regulator
MSLVVAAAVPDVDCPAPCSDPLTAPAVDVQFEFGAHANRVAAMSGAVAAALGLPKDSARQIEQAAPLHDIGKVAIPSAILLKNGPLTAEERRVMEQHTIIGARMLDGSGMPVLEVAQAIALNHHERWDGAGYPNALSGPRIPLPGRIVAIADVFDALTSDRPYKRAWPLAQALDEIRSLRGTHFDPSITDAFLQLDHRALLEVA